MSDGTHLRFVLLIYLQVDVEHPLESAKKMSCPSRVFL